MTLAMLRRDVHARGYGPLILCAVSAPFLVINSVVNIAEDTSQIKGTQEINQQITSAAWIGMLGVSAAMMWNAQIDQRFLAALKGEDWGKCEN